MFKYELKNKLCMGEKHMKNHKLIGLLVLTLCFPILFACDKTGGSESQNNADNMERMYVDVNYDENTKRVEYSVNNVLNSSTNLTMHSKKSNNVISTVVAGDYLEVYYEDEDKTVIDEIKVDEASAVEMSFIKISPPGSQGMEINYYLLEDNDDNKLIQARDVEYVINEDGSFTSIYDILDDTKLCGIYREEDIKINTIEGSVKSYEYTIYNMIALYSYSPRLG